MQLDRCKRGQLLKITSIVNSDVRAQAIRFGIGEGEVVSCQQVLLAGPVIVSKNHQEIAIGRRLARQIEVELIS